MTNLKDLKKVKSFDVDEFDGVKSTIESVELLDVEKKDFGDGEQELRQILIKSANLEPKNEKGIYASEYVGLKKDPETQEWGIPENPGSKAMKFLKYFKAEDFEDIKGKECLIVKRESKNGKTLLGIHHG